MSIPKAVTSVRPLLSVGRYEIYDRIASGGMAAVHVGMLMVGQTSGMARPVAIKRLHPHLAKDPEFVAMFLDEAKLAARLSHQNIVPTLDVITQGGEVFLVMEYVAGESLATVLRTLNERRQLPPIEIAAAVVFDALQGLGAAHRATNELGKPLGIVHRDISPQNVMVGADGLSRLLDFGIAKAEDRAQYTREGQIRGKIAYLAPEQLRSVPASPRTDLFSMGVVLWESLTARQLFQAPTGAQLVTRVLECQVPPASQFNPRVTPELDQLLARALHRNPEARFQSADEMTAALEAVTRPRLRRDVAAWLQGLAGTSLDRRALQIQAYEKACAQRHAGAAVPDARPPMGSQPLAQPVAHPAVQPRPPMPSPPVAHRPPMGSQTVAQPRPPMPSQPMGHRGIMPSQPLGHHGMMVAPPPLVQRAPSSETIPTLLSPPAPTGQADPLTTPVKVIVPPPAPTPPAPPPPPAPPLQRLPDLSVTSSWPGAPYRNIDSNAIPRLSPESESRLSATSLLVAQGRAWVMPTRIRQALVASRQAAAGAQAAAPPPATGLAALRSHGLLPSRRNGGLMLVTGIILGALIAWAFFMPRPGEPSGQGSNAGEPEQPATPVLAPTDLPPAPAPSPKR
jgi:eukaryotic-like serine/threonine-protein kinase